MDISIATSDPDNVDPAEIAKAVEAAGFLVISVDVNEGERKWEMGEARGDDEPHTCKGQPHCGWFGPECGYDTIEEEPHAYTLQQIRQGTGFPPNARFRQVSRP